MLDNSKRPGTRPTIVLTTDGLANRNLATPFRTGGTGTHLLDYDGNGTADYTTNNAAAQYTLMKAKEAVDVGYTIHCMTVGLGADQQSVTAIAWLDADLTSTSPVISRWRDGGRRAGRVQQDRRLRPAGQARSGMTAGLGRG